MDSILEKRINKLDDFQLLRFFNYLGQSLFEGIEASSEELKNGIPHPVKAINEINKIDKLPKHAFEAELSSKEAIAFARITLLNWANDDTLSHLVEHALNSYKDDELVAETILAFGFAASMILLTATTGVKIKIGNMTIEKKAASVEMVKAIVESLSNVISKLI